MLFSFILLSILLFRFLTIQNYRLHQQTIDVYVEDNFGQMVKLSFEFNSQKDEEKEKTNGDKK